MGTLLVNRTQNHLLADTRTIERLCVRHLVTSFEAGSVERQFTELLLHLDREHYDVRLAAIRREGSFYEEIATEAQLDRQPSDGIQIDSNLLKEMR